MTLNSCSVLGENWTTKPNYGIHKLEVATSSWDIGAPVVGQSVLLLAELQWLVLCHHRLTSDCFSLCCSSGKSSGSASPPSKLDGSKVIKFYYSGSLSACAHSVSLLWHKMTCWNRYRGLLARSEIRHDGVLAKSSSTVLGQQLSWTAPFWTGHVSHNSCCLNMDCCRGSESLVFS